MPAIDLSILNQRQTPAFYADTLANRPAAGFVGRIFVSTDTFAFYRDNGTTWDLIGGPGTGTITGSGANGQVSYWNGASTITGSNDLFFDAVNGHLGINTITPGTALDVHHDQSTVLQLQQTVATNDNRITFINTGAALWRIGSFYNAGANDFGIFDVVGAAQPVTIKKTTGQVLIGTSTVGSGKLVVASATGDNGVQIVGATAPSLRIDNAESGPTKRAGLGISTAVNNFIQGSADRDFCIFNSSTSASPILFGIYDAGLTNTQEATRISPARNFLIGTTTDSGEKLQVSGTSKFTTSSTNPALLMPLPTNANATILQTYSSNIGFGWKIQQEEISTGDWRIFRREVNIDYQVLNLARSNGAATFSGFVGVNGSPGTNFPLEAYINSSTAYTTSSRGNTLRVYNTNNNANIYAGIELGGTGSTNDGLAGINAVVSSNGSGTLTFYTRNSSAFSEKFRVEPNGNLLIGTTTDNGYKLQVNGVAYFSQLARSDRGFLISNGAYANIGQTEFTGIFMTDSASPDGFGALLVTSRVDVARPIIFGTSNGTVSVERFRIKSSGVLNITGIPTSPAGLVSGDIYSNLGVLTIVP